MAMPTTGPPTAKHAVFSKVLKVDVCALSGAVAIKRRDHVSGVSDNMNRTAIPSIHAEQGMCFDNPRRMGIGPLLRHQAFFGDLRMFVGDLKIDFRKVAGRAAGCVVEQHASQPSVARSRVRGEECMLVGICNKRSGSQHLFCAPP